MVAISQSQPEQDVYYEASNQPGAYPGYNKETTSTNIAPLLQQPQSGTIYAQSDDIFLRWLFDHKSRTILPLKQAWRGLEWSNDTNKWEPIGLTEEDSGRIMNEKGITWGASLLESYFNPVFLATNMSVRNYNFRMRTASRFILMTLHERYKEFDLLQSNIDRVAEEIESKISALLAGAINDGYRRFLTTQTHIQESKVYGVPQQQGGFQSLFSRPASPQQGATY
jgi:hypothetical protein